MPKAKPVSLFPLKFDEAIAALVRVDPTRVGIEHKQRKKHRRKTKNKK
jgi:hypothetical protein